MAKAEPRDTAGQPAAVVLALTLFLAPTLGVPSELVLQDTLKSAIVAFGALLALFLLGWQMRKPAQGQGKPLAWHGLMLLPLLLLLYALGSMHWSHAYLAGGEAIRWFVFAVLLWTGMQVLAHDRAELLAQGIHWGAVMASLWTALQFWVDFRLFPQGPNPASTFINRNFFAEFAVCTLPFSLWLALNARGGAQIALRAALAGFVWVAIMMTGTRSALLAMLALLLVLPYIGIRYRHQFGFSQWSRRQQAMAAVMALCTVLGLGAVPSNNPSVLAEDTGRNALQRSFLRTASMTEKKEYTERSFSVRYVMWKATTRMLRGNPVTGVGAGAWEVYIPLYQEDGAQLETDYYAHNEFLQLLAEYGLAGWLFLALLLGYLCQAAWRTWRAGTPQARAEAPLRALVLASLLALLVVSNAGFAWRMASTGAMFALCLALLAASDLRLGLTPGAVVALRWRPGLARAVTVLALAGGGLAAYITQQAMACETTLVRSIQMALTISQSADPRSPQWEPQKRELLQLAREGIAINPHYRKLTAMLADELARWGDWKNATWIWESVARSRPYVVAILGNIARGYGQMGDMAQAVAYFNRAKALQPNAPSVRSFELVLLARNGQERQAAQLLKRYFAQGSYDYDMVSFGFLLGRRTRDWPLAVDALQRRAQGWPEFAVESWMTVADIQANEVHDDARALQAYRAAMQAATPQQREQLRQNIPAAYRARL
jgi:O-antigen ligase